MPPLPASPVELEAETADSFFVDSVLDDSSAAETPVVHCVAVTETHSGHQQEPSDAHFRSQQSLFTPPEPPFSPTANAGHDFIDVASFLELGHVPDCWCKPCQDMYRDSDFGLPEPVSRESEDGGWMFCGGLNDGERSPAVCEAWEWEWGRLVEDGSEFADQWMVEEKSERESGEWCSSPSAKAHGAW